jgi:lysophospholipase L1-like esterase
MKWPALLLAGNLVLLAACGGSGRRADEDSTTTTAATRSAESAASSTTAPPPRDPVVVGLGNSVPAGAACGCQNFVSAYAQMVATGTNTKATVDNDAVSGSTSADLVNLLTKSSVQSHLRSATTVLIMTGANDYGDAFDQVSLGAPATETYAPVATAVEDNVTAVVQQIHALNAAARVVVLDYWAAMQDGAVAAQNYDAPTQAAADASTTSVNQALALATKATRAIYVSSYTAMKGPDGTKDPTSLLAPDGDHPNAAGHQVIAQAVYTVLPAG